MYACYIYINKYILLYIAAMMNHDTVVDTVSL